MYKNFADIQGAIKKGVSVKDILHYYFNRIEEENKSLNAFLEVFRDSAIETATKIDGKIKNGTSGRLAGMIIGIKDNICYKNHKVTASSKIVEGFESIYSATAVNRLLAEDAIIIGRLNCDEFAMGSSNENSAYGDVKNPRNKEYVPGGSSGGSAVAVAGNLCTVALGSDTGGSIRQPASFTGTIGLKPTYGRVSRFGLIAYASSFDQIGPITNSIEDAALVTEIIAGKDEYDSTSSSQNVESLIPKSIDKKLKIAYFNTVLSPDKVDKEIIDRTKEILSQIESEGHELVPVSLEYIEQLVPTYYVLSTAEASTNLSRFDGVHFGYRSENAKGVEETYVKSRTEGFGKEVKRRIMSGTFVLSQGYYDAYYSKAQKVRKLIQDSTNKILSDADAILLPTTPSTAFKIGKVADPIKMYLQDIFTVQANLSGNPAISLPMGEHSNGMPFGIQLIGKSFQENELLSIANFLMKLK